MMDRTDRHFRFLIRLLSRHTVLFTEMITAQALHHGDSKKLLRYHPEEHPLILQLGGSDPVLLGKAALLAKNEGYDEINLNVGCPSERVQSGSFGVCLMVEPEQVAQCVQSMMQASGLPVSVKHRIGFDHHDSYEELSQFVSIVAGAGCKVFQVHARKAWLKGLSPKENREKPPLRYDIVERLKKDFPNLLFMLNGGIVTLDQVESHLGLFDGVMIGREAYRNPHLFSEIDARFFGVQDRVKTREEVVNLLIPYVRSEMKLGERFPHISRHFVGLYLGTKGAKAWRQTLAEGKDAAALERALDSLGKNCQSLP